MLKSTFYRKFTASLHIIKISWHPLQETGWNLSLLSKTQWQWQVIYSFEAPILLTSIPSEISILSQNNIFILFIWKVLIPKYSSILDALLHSQSHVIVMHI